MVLISGYFEIWQFIKQQPTNKLWKPLSSLKRDCKDKYPVIAEQWRRHWDHLIMMFNYPEDIRRVICTTNAIESVNNVIRKAITRHKMFPSDEAALKVVYLAIDAISKK